MAQRLERFDKKVQYQVFIEKVTNYVISNLKDGGDIQTVYTELKDPTNNFQEQNKPIKLLPDDFGGIDEVHQEIYKEEVKQFVQQKINIRRNVEKSYGLVWGQWSADLKQYIKGISLYESRSKIFGTVWLLKELKKATSGIDNKANPYITMYRSMSNIYKMKHGGQESNDHYIDHFKSNITALDLAGDGHIFVYPTISGKDVSSMSTHEITEESDKSKAILLLQCSDDARFGDLADSLNAGTLRDRDEYPQSLAAMYELMIKYLSSLQHTTAHGRNRRRQTVTLLQAGTGKEESALIPGKMDVHSKYNVTTVTDKDTTLQTVRNRTVE